MAYVICLFACLRRAVFFFSRRGRRRPVPTTRLDWTGLDWDGMGSARFAPRQALSFLELINLLLLHPASQHRLYCIYLETNNIHKPSINNNKEGNQLHSYYNIISYHIIHRLLLYTSCISIVPLTYPTKWVLSHTHTHTHSLLQIPSMDLTSTQVMLFLFDVTEIQQING